ncbi:MAG: sensor histidine kinase [Polyangiales bacterium]
MSASATSSSTRRLHSTRDLGIYLLAGIGVGIGYAALNTLFDVLDRAHRVFAGSSVLHLVVDRVLPVITGALLGAAIFAWRSRSRDASRAAVRADDLAARLRGVERDQAVWVVATAALHDLRNPLHSLGLLVDELSEVPADDASRSALVERARVQIDRVRESVATMRRLADAANPVPVELSLSGLVREVVESQRASARAHEVTFSGEIEDDLRVRGDPLHLRIVLDAVLTNAIDVLRAHGGHVDVELAHGSGTAVLRISDDGPGIDPALSARLFEPLTTTKSTGLGLGLSIARALSRSGGGDLALVDRPGWKTTFELRLPMEAG